MKTPREILLQRHTAARPKLDVIREQTLGALSHRENGSAWTGFVVGLRELFAVPRAVWAGLAGVWVIIVALNLISAERPAHESPLASAEPVSREALAEQRRFYAELVQSMTPADVPPFVPRPRSDRRDLIAAA